MANEEVRLHYLALGANVTSPARDFDGVHGVLLVGKRDRAKRKYTDVKDHSVSVLNSRGFIPADLWLRCQNKLAANKQLPGRNKGKHSWLTGLLKCAHCGYSLSVTQSKGFRYLHCSGRYTYKICAGEISVDLAELEQVIADQIQALLDECQEEPVSIPKKDNYSEKLDELDLKAERLMDAFASDQSISPRFLQKAMAKIEKEREQLLTKRSHEAVRPVFHDKVEFHTLPLEEKKTIAKQFIRRIQIYGKDVEIMWQI